MEINPHHLRLFYYLALHGSPTEAARKMPYGIDPSSLTRQICDLEQAITLRLYERRRYRLTPAGEKLFAFIKPMFADLPGLIAGWRKGLPDVVTLGASPVVLREYLPSILAQLQKNFPGVELICNEGTQAQIQAGLKENAIDLAITTLEGNLPTGYERTVLARLPLILLVPRKSKLRAASQLWERTEVKEKLVSLPADNPISMCFHQGLKRRGVNWPLGMAANSIEGISMETQTTAMTVDEIRNISARITALQGKMSYLANLTPEQRADKRNVKLSGKKLLLLRNRLDAATAHRGLLPPMFDLQALDSSVALLTALSELSSVLSRVLMGVNDSITVLANPTVVHAATAISYIKIATITEQRLRPTESQRKIRASVPTAALSPAVPQTAPTLSLIPLATANPIERAA